MTERVTQITRNPWKLTAIGMALVAATALVTGIVMASRSTRRWRRDRETRRSKS